MNKKIEDKIKALPTLDEIVEENVKDPEFALGYEKARDRILVDKFHKRFYRGINWRKDITYLGVPILKNPLDLWAIQEIIWARRPDIIIETGTAFGGSALFYTNIRHMPIITIDDRSNNYVPKDYIFPREPYIVYIVGDSIAQETLTRVENEILLHEAKNCMVILDSNHSYAHVTKELELYAPLVSVGQYVVVEDTNTPLVLPNYDEGKGGALAAEEWYNAKSTVFERFEHDLTWEERWGFSFNEYFKRVK